MRPRGLELTLKYRPIELRRTFMALAGSNKNYSCNKFKKNSAHVYIILGNKILLRFKNILAILPVLQMNNFVVTARAVHIQRKNPFRFLVLNKTSSLGQVLQKSVSDSGYKQTCI